MQQKNTGNPVMEKIHDSIVHNRTVGTLFQAFEKTFGYPMEKAKFQRQRGYSLNLKNPVTYAEKIVWKKLYDRNPLIPLTSDKYRVRDYVRQRLGNDLAEEILVPLLYVTDMPETIPFDDLPERYIIKANHASGWNIIVNQPQTDHRGIIQKCRKWLKQCYGATKNEWAYKQIPPKIIIEALLQDENKNIPMDYKFYTFHGITRVINVIADRQGEEHLSNSYDRQWNYLVKADGRPPKFSVEKPPVFHRMLEIAETLARDFDAVRVDLYTMGEHIYFGEMTHYHGSGSNMKKPMEEDIRLGSYWHLDTKPGSSTHRQ